MTYPKYLFNALLNKATDVSLLKPTLSKCKYPISIYTELKSIFASDDYFSGLRYFIGNQPLEDVPGDEKTREEIIITETENLSGESEFLATQPHIKKLMTGIEDLQDFAVDFIRDNHKIHCKEGFTDLLLANFAKYNNPSKFADLRVIFDNDAAPCAAYEDEAICSSLPMDEHEFIAKAGELAYNEKDSFKVNIGNSEGE